MRPVAIGLVLLAALSSGQGKRTLTGVITDSMCATGDHSRMKMGSDDAECTIACIFSHGAQYVLWDGKDVYTLSDQKTPEAFAGKTVNVTGLLDGKAIRVEKIELKK